MAAFALLLKMKISCLLSCASLTSVLRGIMVRNTLSLQRYLI